MDRPITSLTASPVAAADGSGTSCFRGPHWRFVPRWALRLVPGGWHRQRANWRERAALAAFLNREHPAGLRRERQRYAIDTRSWAA